MMTPLEWFAFVILPATLAVIAFGVSRLFDRLHPLPVNSSPEINPDAVGASPFVPLTIEQQEQLQERVRAARAMADEAIRRLNETI